MLLSSLVVVFSLPVLRAAVVATPHSYDHPHEAHRPLPGAWYQEAGHPVHSLFRRAPGDGAIYPAVGTPDWSAGFPPAGAAPDSTTMPQSWLAALNAAVADGTIPDIPQSSTTAPNTNPVYPQGINPNSPQVCSASYRCRIPGDIWDAPDGVYASSFDDGPLPPTPQLVQFLKNNSLSTTHFMIGVNILWYPSQFQEAYNAGHDIAVHTWSHPYMTTLSNVDVTAQLGWTMQLIHNSTGGRVPRYWRPPYGDSDIRIHAIAKEVFGLETVIWNSDSTDWGATSVDQVVATVTKYLTGPKSPGLVLLEHTNSAITVGGFMAVFPLIGSNGWSFRSLAEVIGGGRAYQNANSSTSDISSKGILLNSVVSDTTTASASASSTLMVSTTSSMSRPSETMTSSALSPCLHPFGAFIMVLSGFSFLFTR